jgi:hypothetical protein
MQRGVGERADDPTLMDPKVCAGYCNAMRLLDEVDEEWTEHIGEDGSKFRARSSYDAKNWPFDAFPTSCERCSREMEKPERQIFADEIYLVKTGDRSGQTFVRRELPVGAMFEIDYYRDIPDWCGRDGISLFVVTPGGEWGVDMRANNCTRPDDKAHRCWVRRGDPRTGYVHVDKDATIQETCEAGAGSIWINKDGPRDWHGFLYRGYLCNADDRPTVDQMLDAPNPVAPAERVLSVTSIDRPVTVPPVIPPAVGRPAVRKAFGNWRASRRR